ncbi:hypothetical protein ATCC90586_002298 [Pythium insidiosum]|nr:hypothetical protein ATCC90586_002298 [Pythium insidiosum]
MRLATLLAAVALPLAASSASAPSPVSINGWFPCSASTLYASESNNPEEPPEDFYLETKAKGARRGRHGSRRAPPPTRGGSALHVPFLEQSMEVSARRSAWSAASREKPPASKASHKTWGRGSSLARPVYECAEFRVPLCYEGICTSNRTIDVFVKRAVAQRQAPDGTQKSLWVLQGGPGASSTAMEDLMVSMYQELEGEVTLYTMDHRGTARSHRLECQAAEAQTPGSPGGTGIVVSEVPNCIDDLLFKMDNQTAAFSVTSAAMDLRTIIEHAEPEHDVYVYGLSYGTYLVERLMHFAPSNVKGFSIDGIVSESGASVEERSTFSNWDFDVGVVGARLLGYCMKDPFCKSKFPNVKDLAEFTLQLYKRLDEDAARRPGTNACADVLGSTGRKPSYFMRSTLAQYLSSDEWRTAIPAIIYRAARCNSRDVHALQSFVDLMSGDDGDGELDIDDALFTSEMLYYLIVFSEMWEYPSPSKETLVQWYEGSVMASDNYYSLPYYCLFTGSREDACKALKNLPSSRSMAYPRDQFWNVTAKLPPGTSALLMSGGLDPQTRRMYGSLEYDLMAGNRMLVQFDYAGHCTTFTTPTIGDAPSRTCGVQILASYVRANGVVTNVNTDCVGKTYPLDFNGDRYMANYLFSTTSLYD